MDFQELYRRAAEVAVPHELSLYGLSGVVGAALLTQQGHVYVGVNVDTACAVGFCAEHAAAAAMLTAHENVVVKMIAVNSNGQILPPCGRCREFINQLSDLNCDAEVMIGVDSVVRLHELLPHDWRKVAPKQDFPL